MTRPLMVLLRSTRVLIPAVLVPVLGWGQQTTAGMTVSQFIASGEGVARSCLQSEYSTGVGVLLATPVLGKRTTVQVAGRGYWVARGSTCVDGFPPPDGTFVEDDRVNLLSRSFVTTDVRLATGLGDTPLSVALGGGNAWHEGYNLPYVVFAAAVSLLDQPEVEFGLDFELKGLRVSADRYRRTYANFELVSEEPLGRVRRWSHAVLIGVHLSVPL